MSTTAAPPPRDTLIVALNPSIDVEWRVPRFRWEEKNVIAAERRWAGGKGVNVARWLKFLGGRPRLLLPLGGGTGRELAGHLRAEKIAATVVPIHEPTRVNVIVSTDAQGQMRFNPPGPELRRPEWRAVVDRVRTELRRTELLVLSGSLPRGVPVGAYAELLRLAHAAGIRTLLDCEGPALAAAVPRHPWLVKPNEDELAQWHGRRLGTRRAVLRAAKGLSRKTGGWVLVSRGARGAMLVNEEHDYAWSCAAPRLPARNTVGAGDAMLAAVARGLVLNLPPPDWLQFAIATGSAATLCAPGTLPVNWSPGGHPGQRGESITPAERRCEIPSRLSHRGQ